MKKIQINIKTVQRLNRSESIPSQTSSAKNLRRNEPMHDMLYLSIENLGFQCVQDAGHFASVQCGFGVLRITPAGEICPCGRKDAPLDSFPCLLEIQSKINGVDEKENSDKLLRTFC
ncbi:unnamed protein product, partial [Hymenolepis diminuta]